MQRPRVHASSRSKVLVSNCRHALRHEWHKGGAAKAVSTTQMCCCCSLQVWHVKQGENSHLLTTTAITQQTLKVTTTTKIPAISAAQLCACTNSGHCSEQRAVQACHQRALPLCSAGHPIRASPEDCSVQGVVQDMASGSLHKQLQGLRAGFRAIVQMGTCSSLQESSEQ